MSLNLENGNTERTHLLLVIHCPVTDIEGSSTIVRIVVSRTTHILLLLPVPRSIMMCLLLQLGGGFSSKQRAIPWATNR